MIQVAADQLGRFRAARAAPAGAWLEIAIDHFNCSHVAIWMIIVYYIYK